jgi:hypothetical protein
MATLKLNAFMNALHGAIGDLVVVGKGDNLYVQRRARKRPPPTGAQEAQIGRFALASRWARTALADPAVKAAYQAACRGNQTAHNLAIKDFLHPPAVASIAVAGYHGQPGDSVRIVATDDFKVTRVLVQVRRMDGDLLEEGAATSSGTDHSWLYRCQTEVPPGTTVLIEATAWDLPGNHATGQAWAYVDPGQSAERSEIP